ncbi:hypothetical protein SAMN05421867_11751 [Cellulomonas marina]|uniref:Uncharacterized protein n=1 Tax=Cellulomonas marina TaxID=988821 RepID=A0A1I1ADR9_9CELL|nr:hypothetical protein SAMN05421867_11751 [Cellulomonas marina]
MTISCSCGVAASVRRHPLRRAPLAERLALLAAAVRVEDGFCTVELDGSWHPDGEEPGLDCVVLADLDELDATEGLDPREATQVRAALTGVRLLGRDLPGPLEVDGLRLHVRPAWEYAPALVVSVDDAQGPVVELLAAPDEVDLLPALVELHRTGGRSALHRLARASWHRGRLREHLVVRAHAAA